MLGIFPCIIPQLREASNRFHFTVCTSGFTAVTNEMLMNYMEETLNHVEQDKINMIE